MFRSNKAFRIIGGDNGVTRAPINNMDKVILDDLIGYEPEEEVMENTEAFVREEKLIMRFFSVTAEQVSQLLSRLLSMNIMTRVLE